MKNPAAQSKSFWFSIAFLLALAFMLGQQFFHGGGHGSGDRPDYAKGTLSITRADGIKIPFKVEIATTPRQHQYGLMFVQHLAPDAGMIFMQPGDFEARFWMKNTLIPLDMLFVRNDGVIVKIVANAKPLDLSPLRSDQPVRAIIEINGGEAAKRGITEGDKVLFPGLGSL